VSALENALQSRLLLEAPKQIADLRLFRRQIMAGRIEGRFMRAGIVGQADLHGYFRGGIAIELELKALRGRHAVEQIAWSKFCVEWGVIYLKLQAGKLETPEVTVDRWLTEITKARSLWVPPASR